MRRREFLSTVASGLVCLSTGLPIIPSDTVPVLLTYPSESLVPKMWAKESLRILQENMVVSQLIHKELQYD